ncbi:MAG TPA: rhodanese-like domain-containing protein [Campylobacterales bacterium]|nr:rhodanese-like domain-containing protein [Campylobacterales bacterium]
MKKLLIFSLFPSLLLAQNVKEEHITVKITDDMPYITTTNSGKKVRIERIQDTDNRLTDDYTKTSRPCPPFCIQPTHIDEGINNIEEIELLKFIQDKVSNNTGVVIDTRLKSWFEIETIPSAINIPYPIIQNASKKKAEKIFKILGMKVKSNGSWDFSKAKELAIFCNGVWCEQSKHFIDGMIKHGYPKEKMHYYRSGFQGWKLLGLTTVVHKEIKK